MDRWFFSFITAWTLSAWWPQWIPLAVLPLLVMFAFTCFLRPASMVTAGIAIVASIWVASVGHWQHHWQHSLFEQGREHWLEGQISSLVHSGKPARFTFSVNRIDERRLWFEKSIALRWFKDQPELRLGQQWRLKARLRPLHSLANEGGSNGSRAMQAKGIVMQGYVISKAQPTLLAASDAWRENLSQRLQNLDLTQYRFIAALSLGDRRFFTVQDWELLQRTGTAHLMAISGMHLVVTASILYAVLNAFLPRVVRWGGARQSLNLKSVTSVLILAATLLYAGLSGFALPVLRAWFGLVVIALVNHLRLSVLPRQTFLWVVAIVLMCTPNAPLSASFWLSISAVSVLIFCHWCFSEQPEAKWTFGLRALCKLQWRLFLLLWPVTGIWFGMVSLSGLVANLVAIPVVTLILVPLCLLALPLLLVQPALGSWLLRLADMLTGQLFSTLAWLSTFPHSAVFFPSVPTVGWALFGAAMLIFCLPKLPVSKVFVFCWLLPLGSYLLPSLAPRVRLDVLDVGQGSAAVLSVGERAMVFDAGASWEQGSMARRVLLPFFKTRGIETIDAVVLSHLDNDHAGGLPDLLAHMPVVSVLSPDKGCHTPLNWRWLQLEISVLWPPSDNQLSANNGSCVVRVSGEHFSVLFSGDIEALAEIQLLDWQAGEALRADILIAPHHGSATSSSSAFVTAVKPQHVVFSHGFMHRWNFPAQVVVNRYVEAGAKLYSTAESGQVSFLLPTNGHAGIEVRRFRDY